MIPPRQTGLASFFGGGGGKRPESNHDANETRPPDKKIRLESPSRSPSPPGNGRKKDHSDSPEPESPLPEKEVVPESTFFKGSASKASRTNERPSLAYSELCAAFAAMEATTKRLEITKITANLFFSVLTEAVPSNRAQALITTLYLCSGKLRPDYEGLELGLGEGLLVKAVAEASARSIHAVKADMVKTGDLGTVAWQSKARQPGLVKTAPLTIDHVYQQLLDIAMTKGKDSQLNKVARVRRLLAACKGDEAKYLIRALEGKLRISLADKTILTALTQAFVKFEAKGLNSQLKNPESAAKMSDGVAADEILKQAYSELPSYDLLIPLALEHGVMNLSKVARIAPGVPVKPMLAKPTKSITEVLDRFSEGANSGTGENFTCEYKYDGERSQVHMLPDGTVKIFSRNSEDMSEKYPDVVAALPSFIAKDTKSFIIDCESVAFDVEQNRIRPFQILATRKRKDVVAADIKVQVCLFAFDLIYLNDSPMLKMPLSERRKYLHQAVVPHPGKFQFATGMDIHSGTADAESQIQTFLDQSVEDCCEGLMIKSLEGPDSYYEPSQRSRNWLKLKKDYLKGIGDSLDLVVLGAYYGKGKRTSVYGAFLLGCYNPQSGEYETICKIGTGFSDQLLSDLYKSLSAHVIPKPRGYYSYTDAPEVWFEPAMVWEVLAADLSLSPIYKAAAGELEESVATQGRGVSLRFPRFIRIRDDKPPEEATSSDQVADFYLAQKGL